MAIARYSVVSALVSPRGRERRLLVLELLGWVLLLLGVVLLLLCYFGGDELLMLCVHKLRCGRSDLRCYSMRIISFLFWISLRKFLLLLRHLSFLHEMERERFIRLGGPRYWRGICGVVEQLVAAHCHTRRWNLMRLCSCYE